MYFLQRFDSARDKSRPQKGNAFPIAVKSMNLSIRQMTLFLFKATISIGIVWIFVLTVAYNFNRYVLGNI